MTITEFVEMNVDRCYSEKSKEKWGDTSNRTLVDWALCVAGEAGELCNAVKKFTLYKNERLRSMERRQEVVDECCDVVTYCFLLLAYILPEKEVEKALLRKFDEVSERVGYVRV